MDGTHGSEAEGFENTPLTPTRLGAAAAVFDIVAFTFIGYLVLEDPALGAVSGLLIGLGVYQFLPLMMQPDGLESNEDSASGNPVRGYHRLAGGYGLSVAGLVFFAVGFAEFELLVGVPAALVAGAVVYIVAGFVFPNAAVGE
ncbi:hypothetical protein [Halostagnicola sp. A-GB9-2]|uniref:hypothetical protein n=1 Tax=Halostagnicola sp. A-GB9-2 TaxID=3048066 RepID=UPI0024C06D3D|nr:hypothetical protein [Halostagnicola sp. A-GB9-2]MDJ1431325.1 hypothetical protein [Halostagnicola sp. A-GB9-2]